MRRPSSVKANVVARACPHHPPVRPRLALHLSYHLSELAFTAVLPVELALKRPRGAGLPERRPVDEFVTPTVAIRRL